MVATKNEPREPIELAKGRVLTLDETGTLASVVDPDGSHREWDFADGDLGEIIAGISHLLDV